MDCEQVTELLPWFLNGSLEGSERQAVEQHLLHCQRCLGEVRETEAAAAIFAFHPTPEELLDFAHGLAAGTATEQRLQQHLQSCAICRAELTMARESLAELINELNEPAQTLPEPEPEPEPWPARSLRRTVSGLRWFAAAAVVLGLLAAAGWFSSWQALQRSHTRMTALIGELQSRLEQEEASRPGTPVLANVPVIDLFPVELDRRGADETTTVVTAAGDDTTATLILNTQLRDPAATLRLELCDQRGVVILVLDRLTTGETGDFAVSLPVSRLGPGRYQLRVIDAGPEPEQLLESYLLRIK